MAPAAVICLHPFVMFCPLPCQLGQLYHTKLFVIGKAMHPSHLSPPFKILLARVATQLAGLLSSSCLASHPSHDLHQQAHLCLAHSHGLRTLHMSKVYSTHWTSLQIFLSFHSGFPASYTSPGQHWVRHTRSTFASAFFLASLFFL